MVLVRGNRLGNSLGKVWVGARASQPNWVATVATPGFSVLERAAAAASAHGVKGPPVRAREAASGANCSLRDPTPIDGDPSNTHCTVRPSSKASKLTTGSGSSILRSTSEGSCPPFAF